MTSTVYEYGTPSLGGYVHGKKIFLTFSHWGVQCIDTKSNNILSTWNRPSANDQFTSPITYSNDHKWLISSVFNKNDKKCKLLLWNANALDLKDRSIPLSQEQLKPSEFIIRIFHSVICHHCFIIITNLGNIILFDPNKKTFDYKSNPDINDESNLIYVKLHDAISSSGHHKKITHISFIYASQHQQQLTIIPISFNPKANVVSIHDSIQLSLPKNVCFYNSDLTDGDDDDDEDDDIVDEKPTVTVIDYDWCLDTNNLLLLMSDGAIQCIDYIHGKKSNSWKYNTKYVIKIGQHVDVSAMNTLNKHKIKDENVLYSMHHTSLLSFVRIKFIESSQFIVIGPSNKDYNTLKLWSFQAEHGLLRDAITLVAQNSNSSLLMIAPIISVVKHKNNTGNDNMQLIDVYAITSKQVVSVRLPSSGKSLLDLVEISVKNENKMDIDEGVDDSVLTLNDAQMLLHKMMEHNTRMEQHSFNMMVDCLVDNEEWDLIKNYFVLIKDHNESNVLYLLSLMMSHLKYFSENRSFLCCLNTILSAKINDIFMKRCIQILPQSQVEALIRYLCVELDGNDDDGILNMDVIITWFNIVLDAHLATLAFSSDPNLYKHYILKIRECLRNYDKRVKSMMSLQANIHSILNGMKVEYNNNKNKNNLKNRNTSKPAHGIGGGAFAFDAKGNSDENDPNLYKDYVVEYIKL